MERKSRVEVISVGSLAKAAEAAGFAMAPAEGLARETPLRVVWDGIPWRQDAPIFSRQTSISFASTLTPRLALAMSWWKSRFGAFGRHAPA
jgi:hypothetical protein